ncbi:MAG TPA: murein L,D-transpeptidase family protein [Pseudomonadota bacterium]|nr:murein L,D-transpeptidase [Rhodanobacteraceae bacterium]MBP9155882.1 murein L,D-transpeptidase [Xanthomonadales bacterium]HQW81614.1 murein L,D-transpeptidase family protein [Pseudomonadota bacterium]
MHFPPRHWLVFVLLSAVSVILLLWPISGRSVLATIGIAGLQRADQAEARVREHLTQRLHAIGADWGAPVFVRIFKQERELEVWAQTGTGVYALLDTWPVCTYSGDLGPKQREGDGQAPEGIYQVRAGQLNPNSSYHLSFDLGYPNAFDRAHARNGSYLMVHGACVSIGCYAMTDAGIEDIYTLLAAALGHGQHQVQVHALPFRFEAGWEQAHGDSRWRDFWRDLAAIDAEFVSSRKPPAVRVSAKRYVTAGAESP